MAMKKAQIVNIVNFIRGCEPRCKMDLVEPVREQIALLNQYGFRGTFLLQYDALIEPAFTELLKTSCIEGTELGVWLEIVQPQVETAGLPWRGRFPWDWHADTGFSVGYSPKEREQLIDLLFEKFKEVFGYYPKVMGSWIIDAHSLAYASQKYGLDASCNCKDQWGTDGYTLWGAYYNQAYYPAKTNVFCPASSREEQINTPVFRMLGSDPVEQYDFGLDENAGAPAFQGVITLEPVYTDPVGGGGNLHWVDWYLKENFNGKCLSFAYTQAGQENSFGWAAMEKGLRYQFARFDELQKAGVIEVEPLGQSGRRFQAAYPVTPATAICTDSGFASDRRSLWYNCKNYRLNLITDGDRFYIRDIYLFDPRYEERYLKSVCTTSYLQFDNLPFVDGNRFTSGGVRAGIYPTKNGEALHFQEMIYEEVGDDALKITFTNTEAGKVVFEITPDGLCVLPETTEGVALLHKFDPHAQALPQMKITEAGVTLTYRGYPYSVETAAEWQGAFPLYPAKEGKVQLKLTKQ